MKRKSLTFLSIVVALVFTQIFAAGSQLARADEPNAPGGPDFSNVTDILGGRRALFPVDDLMVTLAAQNQPLVVNVAQTAGGLIGNQFDYTVLNNPEAFAAGGGRMWELPLDVIITLTTGQMLIRAKEAEGVQDYQVVFPLSNSGAIHQGVMTMADFTGDGFEDVAYIQNGSLFISTAQDVTKISQGIWTSDAGTPVYPVADSDSASLAAGDLDGDGTTELILAHAWGGGAAIDVFDVQVVGPSGIQLSVVGGTYVSAPTTVQEVKLVAGNFSGTVNPSTMLPQYDLVVAYKYRQDENNHIVEVSSVQVTTQSTDPLAFTLTPSDQYQVIDSGVDVDLADMVSDHLSFYDPVEQVVVGVQEQDGYNGYINVLTLDSDLNISHASGYQTARSLRMMGLALGNYDQDTDASSPVDLEVAALMLDEILFTPLVVPALYLYDVDPSNNFSLQEHTYARVGSAGPYNLDESFNISLSAGDYQGRSLLLGPPTKLVVEHVQPDVVLGMPPMHVDWVAPAATSTDPNPNPEALNVSAVPGGFNSSYQTAVTDQDQSSRKSTTSYTHAVSTTTSLGYKWGNAATGSVSVQFTASAGYMHQDVVSKVYNTYASQGFNASTQTGFDDQIWFNDERHNIYVYPVIGQAGCPADNPDCNESEKAPLQVMFSGPDQIQQTSIAAAAVEWYQPVHEPGNVLSYPWNLAQLQAIHPNIHLLTSDTPTEFFTDVSILKELAQWQEQNSQSVTSGTTNNINWGASVSVSRTPPKLTGGVTGSFSAAYNGSRSVSTLNTSTTSLGQSTGIGVNKPGTFPRPDQYQYGVEPYIFGSNPVTGALQTINVGTDVQTDGILYAQFVADPTTEGAGVWWQGAYTQPDVALNHPSRWAVSSQNLPSPLPDNCVRMGAQTLTVNCAAFNAPGSDIWSSEFYWMKGLVITPAGANGEGPQITQATAGEGVLLQVRVYNYSLADMPAGSGVIVQFYGQPWDQGTLQPTGDAFLIDQVGLAPIPAFNSISTAGTLPNWAVASTDKLDTAAHSDQFLAFWVLVWIQDSSGNLITEMPDHGLTDIPDTLSSISDASDYLEDYSNNVGLYKSLFYIAPQNAELSARPGEGDLTIEQVAVEPKRALLNEKVTVSAMLRAGEQAVDGVSVTFYDGDPNNGGKAFEHEGISHIRANEVHQVRVPFRPTACGVHTLYVKTHPQAQTASVDLNVRIKPLPVVRDLIWQTRQLELSKHDKRHLLDLLRDARQMFRNRDAHGALHKLHEYRSQIEALRGNGIPVEQADAILAQLDLISSCVGLDLSQDMTNEELIEDQMMDAELVE